MRLPWGIRCVVSPEGGLRYLWRIEKVDPLLLELSRKFVQKGDIVWDIGANLGLFSAAASYFAGPAGQVVSVSPTTGWSGFSAVRYRLG